MKIDIETKIPGWSSKNELSLLASLASRVPENGTIVELGSFAGRTAHVMAKNAPKATLYAIDLWENFSFSAVPAYSLAFMEGDYENFDSHDFYNYFLRNIQSLQNIVPIRGYSQKVALPFDKPVNLIFIDADHDEEPLLEDMKVWWPRMARNGMMVGHDYQMRSVKMAIMRFIEFLHEQGTYVQLIHFPTVSIWGLMMGLEHGKSWGIDCSALYPFGDDGYTRPNAELLITAETEGERKR